MRRTRPALLLVTPALLGALALTGCDDSGSDSSAPVATDSATTSDDTSTTPSSEPTTEPTTDDEAEDTPPSGEDVDLPEAVETPEQGGTYGVVVLSDGSQDELDLADDLAGRYGYTAYEAEIGCLDGAGPALGIKDGTIVSYLVFADIDTAQDFYSGITAEEDDVELPGAAEAKTYCLDG